MFTAQHGMSLYVLCVGIRTNNDYFTLHHRLAFINETGCVYCAVRAESSCVLCGSEN
jgi:hypothetical protein